MADCYRQEHAGIDDDRLVEVADRPVIVALG